MKKLHKAVQELKFWQFWDKSHNQKYTTTLIYDKFLYVDEKGTLKEFAGYSVIRHFKKDFCAKFGEVIL
jgi:hypothetical protein